MKVRLFLFLFIFQMAVCSGEQNLFSKYSKVYVYALSGIEADVSSGIKPEILKTGLNLKLPFLQLKTNIKFDDFNNLIPDYNYGLSLFTNRYFKKFPCSISYGTLSPSGAYSKINNPLLSTSVSPFSVTNTKTSQLQALLPGSGAFSNSPSLFCKAGNFSFLYFPESTEVAIYGKYQIKPNKNLKIDFSTTLGYFNYEEYYFSSWFHEYKKYYHSGSHLVGNIQNSISYKWINTLWTLNFYETPTGTYAFIYQVDNFWKFDKYTIGFSALYNNNLNLLTIKKENLSPCSQFNISLQNKHKLSMEKPIFIKTGVKTYYKNNFYDSVCNIKLGTGIQLSTLLTAFTLVSALSSDYNYSSNLMGLNSFNIKFTNNWNLQKVSPNLGTDITFSDINSSEKKISQKYSLSFIIPGKLKIQNSNSLSITSKGNQIKEINEISSIKIDYSTKYINTSFKLSTVFFRG